MTVTAVELPVFVLLYVIWRLVKRPPFPKLEQLDLDSGRYHNTVADDEDDKLIDEREKGKFGWFWKAYSYIA
jgi:AAT family amino acid transporter